MAKMFSVLRWVEFHSFIFVLYMFMCVYGWMVCVCVNVSFLLLNKLSPDPLFSFSPASELWSLNLQACVCVFAGVLCREVYNPLKISPYHMLSVSFLTHSHLPPCHKHSLCLCLSERRVRMSWPWRVWLLQACCPVECYLGANRPCRVVSVSHACTNTFSSFSL